MYHYREEGHLVKKRVTKNGRRLHKKKDEVDGRQTDEKSSTHHKGNVKAVFLKVNTSGSGWLEDYEVKDLEKEVIEKYPWIKTIDLKSLLKDGKLSYADFHDFILPYLTETPCITEVPQPEHEIVKKIEDTSLKSAPNDENKTHQLLENRDSVSIVKRQIIKQSSSGLRKLVARTASSIEAIEQLNRSSRVLTKRTAKKLLLSRTLTQQDEDMLTKYISERWDSFINFKRKGKDGEVVMTSDEQLTDALPGTYDLLQLVMDQFDSDIVASKPNHAVIKPVQWIPAENSADHGKILCPKYWNCTIPVEIGTEQNLSYYDCCYATKQQQTVALLHRHATVDFVYSENYKRSYVLEEGEGSGGCGIERHAFHHMDCPLEDNSGYFLLGKLVNEDELHLTAFKIPKNHVLYVPPMIIHSNDHMIGKWRTMLADNVPIDHVHFMKETHSHKGCYKKEDIIIQE